jgi:hypothetical protein
MADSFPSCPVTVSASPETDPVSTGEFKGLSQHSSYVKGCQDDAPGRKRRLVLKDDYWKLILDGAPTMEASYPQRHRR